MAHRPVGSATSLGITKTSTASTDFAVQSNVIRLNTRQTHAFVAIGTAANPTASSADYYIPSNSTATLAVTRASQKVVGITTGTTTLIDCPEGMNFPFGIGDRVTLSGANEGNYEYKIKYAEVTAIDATMSHDGLHGTRITVAANTSGITTAFSAADSKDAVLRNSVRVAAVNDGGNGSVHIQQVQITGQA